MQQSLIVCFQIIFGSCCPLDPLAEDGDNISWTPYTYVWNNPMNAIDPDGRNGILTIDKKNKTIKIEATIPFRYQFQLTDHLGNVRILFEDKNQNGKITKLNPDESSKNRYIIDEEEIVVVNHYYPFGMQFGGPPSNAWIGDTNGRRYDYTYNGKEFNKDFGLDWSDYGARWYDATIGRWGAVDPLAENHHNLTPYNYVMNNPQIYTDPFGLDTLNIHRSEIIKSDSDSRTNVYSITFSITSNGETTTLTNEDGDPITLVMMSNKKSDEKEGNEITGDEPLVFQTMAKNQNDDGTPMEGHENEIYLKNSGGRGKFIHGGKNGSWFEGCMGVYLPPIFNQ